MRSTSFTFCPTQRGRYRFSVSAKRDTKLPRSSVIFSKTKQAQVVSNSPDRIEVTVHRAFEQHTAIQTNDDVSYIGTDEQVHKKPNAWGLDDDVVERGM
jgi:hypothetical protein